MTVAFAVFNEMIIAVSPHCEKAKRIAGQYGIAEGDMSGGNIKGLLHAAPKGGLMPGTRIWAVCAAKKDGSNIVTKATTLMFYGDDGYKLASKIGADNVKGRVMFIGILTETYHHSNPYIHVNLCPTPLGEI